MPCANASVGKDCFSMGLVSFKKHLCKIFCNIKVMEKILQRCVGNEILESTVVENIHLKEIAEAAIKS